MNGSTYAGVCDLISLAASSTESGPSSCATSAPASAERVTTEVRVNELTGKILAAGFRIGEHPLNNLITGMCLRGGNITIQCTGARFIAAWRGWQGEGDTPLLAVMECLSVAIDKGNAGA